MLLKNLRRRTFCNSRVAGSNLFKTKLNIAGLRYAKLGLPG
jgi:hypothetical protein